MKVPYKAAYNFNECGVFVNIQDFDINSSYPATMRHFNISPETFVWYEQQTITRSYSEQRYTIADGLIHADINDSKLGLSGSIVLWYDVVGIIPSFLTPLSNMKNEMSKLKAIKSPLYNKPKYNAIKLCLNSMYGVMGQCGGMLYIRELAALITSQARE